MGMVSLRLDDELQGRLDALPGKRSDHLKAAIEAYVDGGVISRVPDDGPDYAALAAEREAIERERAEIARDREALARERASVVPLKKPAPVYVPKKGGERWAEDHRAILDALDAARSSRSLVAKLGWQEMRVDRALARLMGEGMIECVGGLFRRVE